jgi:succinate dehydrogenase hydrophobic anchor subunit
MSQRTILTNQTPSFGPPIDPTPLVEHGDSPAAIILSIAVFVSILVHGITGLVKIIVEARNSR